MTFPDPLAWGVTPMIPSSNRFFRRFHRWKPAGKLIFWAFPPVHVAGKLVFWVFPPVESLAKLVFWGDSSAVGAYHSMNLPRWRRFSSSCSRRMRRPLAI